MEQPGSGTSEKASERPSDATTNVTSGTAATTTTTTSSLVVPVPADSQGVVRRDEILRQVFGDVGDLINDFSCAVESSVLLHGRMYITNRFVCFYSNLFGLEKKIRIPVSHIKSMTKENTAMVIPNAILISTFRKDYLFRSFWDRDECYTVLKDLMDKYKESHREREKRDSKVLDAASMAALSENLTSSVSNPPTSSGDITPPAAAPAPSITTTATTATNTAAAATVANDANAPSSSVLASLNASDEDTTARPPSRSVVVSTNGTPDSSRISSVARRRESRATGVRLPDDEEDETEPKIEPDSPVEVMADDTDYAPIFESELKKSKLNMQVLTGTLPLTPTEFYSLFIDDNAPNNYKKFHESKKDFDVSCSPWTDMTAALGQGREMKFIKPINAPGCSQSRATKMQRVRRFGGFGLMMFSSTRMEDVPAAQTFSVEDMLAVRTNNPSRDKAASPCVTVDISFEVKFLKSTILRYMIETNTNAEMPKWLNALFDHMKQVAASYRKEKDSATVSSARGPSSTSTTAATAATAAATAPTTPPTAAAGSGSSLPVVMGTVIASNDSEGAVGGSSPSRLSVKRSRTEKDGKKSSGSGGGGGGGGFVWWLVTMLLLLSMVAFSIYQWRSTGSKLDAVLRQLQESNHQLQSLQSEFKSLQQTLSHQHSKQQQCGGV